MYIIGSHAIKHWYPDFKREPKDIDYLVNDKTMWDPIPGKEEYLENPVLWNHIKGYNKYLEPNLLLTLKSSHLFWDLFWEKHMFDVQFLLNKGNKINKELFYKLYDYWNVYHSKNRRSDLKMTAEDFFDNALKCEHSHDWLHTLLNPIPTYTKILVDGAEVDVSENKFNNLTFEEKCSLVQEEVMIMAWERYPKLDYRVAYSRMLKKFIISHAPIWEAIFIIENFITLHKAPYNYFKVINEKIKIK